MEPTEGPGTREARTMAVRAIDERSMVVFIGWIYNWICGLLSALHEKMNDRGEHEISGQLGLKPAADQHRITMDL